MAISTHTKGQTSLSEINITPMVDVMLVLLIIFMVTAPFLNEGIDVDLPQATASATKPSEAKDNVITLNTKGEIYLSGDKKSYSLDTVGGKLSSILKDATDKVVFLQADKKVAYGEIVKLMSICKEVGVERIGMVTQPED